MYHHVLDASVCVIAVDFAGFFFMTSATLGVLGLSFLELPAIIPLSWYLSICGSWTRNKIVLTSFHPALSFRVAEFFDAS